MKVSYINGICVQHDAISNAVKSEIGMLLRQGDMDVRLYAYACDDRDIPFQRVESPVDVALDSHFQESDLVVFHFGVYYPLFDLLPAVSAKARKLVIFHNITPKEVLPRHAWETIERSYAQLSACAWADHVVCDSDTNLATLRAASITTPATTLPLAVSFGETPVAKLSFRDGILRLVFVGRFVRSKGPQDLLVAVMEAVETLSATRIHIDLVGNLSFSDPDLLLELRSSIASLEKSYGDRLQIAVRNNVTDREKHKLLNDADLFVLPTYHEGFCVPIVEAFAAGCRVVAYDNSNVPSISGGLATLTPTGDVARLAEAISNEISLVSSEGWRHDGYQTYASCARSHVAQFEPARIERRFIRFIDDFMRDA